jgi:hypothetical protein
MSGVLTKKQVILDLSDIDDEFVMFSDWSGSLEDRPAVNLYFRREHYNDLGAPQTVTVTVEPGDLLTAKS